MQPGDLDWDPPDVPPRRAEKCVCGGDAVGPCPGPLVCPYSGLGPEEENCMTYEELLGHVRTFYGDTSRSRAETKDALENLEFEIQELVETLEDDE